VELQPDMTGAYDRLAQVSSRLGDGKLMVGYFTLALERWPISPLLRYHAFLMRRNLKDPGADRDLLTAKMVARQYGYWPLVWQIEREGR
jgi:hypothetical protein